MKQNRIQKLLAFENELWNSGKRLIAGIDEAGRGPLAGPVVAAAVIFPASVNIPAVDDSKKLTPIKREVLFREITTSALSLGVGIIGEKRIDTINILQATYEAMQQAVTQLSPQPDYLLVDGRKNPLFTIPQTAIVRGDSRCFSIAAASIIAKVTRDRIMTDYDCTFPQYGFARHKGYPTKQHVRAIEKFGFCPIHRTSFKVKALNE